MRYIVGDTETTGLGAPPQAKACEIALIEIDAEMNMINEWESLINPGMPIQPGAAKIHGITDDMVKDAPTIEEAFAEIGIGQDPVVLICHNVKFDRNYLGTHMNVSSELCTLELARKHLPMAPNHRLGTLKNHLQLSLQAEHEAMGDILTVVDLLRHLVPYTGRSFLQLVGAAAKPTMVYTMPFGKHKGMAISDLDVDYRNWLLQQEIGPDLRYTLETLQKAFI